MKYISIREQFLTNLKKGDCIAAETEKNKADIDYIAMMCDISLEQSEKLNGEIDYEAQQKL